jgi:hypothetical protein
MRLMKYFVVVLFFAVVFMATGQKAEAGTSFHVGVSTYPAYYHWSPYYWNYGFYGYWPYYYRPYPYYYRYHRPFGYGYYGYPYYGSSRYFNTGELRIEVEPKEARVYVDGDYVGTVDDYDGWWQRLRLPAGKHRIVIRAPGHAPYAETVRVLPGEDHNIKFEMQPGEDVIDERAMRLDPDEEDRYDRYRRDRRRDYDRDYDRDRYRDGYGRRGERRADPYGRERERYEDRQDRYRDRQYERERDNEYDDRDNEYERSDRGESPAAARDTLVLQISPEDATVYIDGNYYGTAEKNDSGEVRVLLPDGVHKVEVVRPGYESFSQDVRVGEGATDRIVVNLQKK